MNRTMRALGALMGMITISIFAQGALAADRPYKEGPVTDVTAVRTQPGHFDDYMAFLATTYKKEMEAWKAAGLIIGYQVFQATPRQPSDADLYLLVTYKNMAALDGLAEKMDAIDEKLLGSQAQMNQATIDRGKIRTILGDEYIRELILK
ncbi:MAG TPA: hypothetical protein VMT50_05255 [Steroidobacteraceae bacterium]|nr:hypothetical protein [Steroidobacteraceae bacterium]